MNAVDADALFRRIYPSLFQYLQRMTGDPDLAEDVAQEAFVRLLRHPLPENEARRWLFTVATNLVRDGARQKRRRETLLTAAPRPSAAAPAADEELERAERIARVRAALERIPPRDREMLLLREQGFRYSEIAAVVEVAPGSVGSLLARALKKFKEVYNAHGYNDDPPV